MSFFTFVLICAAIAAVIAIVVGVAVLSSRETQLNQMQGALGGFNGAVQFKSANYKKLIAINEVSRKIAFIDTQTSAAKEYALKDILGAELVVDGETLTKSVRSNQVAGAIVGGVLLGGVGAVIGGLSGTKRSEELISSILVQILVNDTQNPRQEIEFVYGECKKGTQSYQDAMDKAKQLSAMLEVIIKREESGQADREAEPVGDYEFDMYYELGNGKTVGITKGEFEKLQQGFSRHPALVAEIEARAPVA